MIGGGDFASDRIVPDCVRAASEKKDIIVRNPYSTRPYQHVLEPVMAYLMVAERQYHDKGLVGNYNVGPDEVDCWTTGRLVSLFCEQWNEMMKADIAWRNVSDKGPHEAGFLKLDCSKIKRVFDWRPRWNVEEAMRKIMEWNQEYFGGGNISRILEKQIEDYIK